MRSAYSYLCYIPDFGRVRSIYPNAAAPHKPPFDMTEFGLIDTIRDMFAAIPRNGFDGIGDDCTVFPLGSGESLVFTADLLAENIHFLRRATSARELGRKSLAVNLSDVAAMGARPIATLLSLAIPHDLPEGWIEDFMEGYRDLSAQYDVGLVGGDTTASDSGLVVNVTAIGRIADSHIKRRSDARPGDLIAVGGSLGESGAGLRDILAGRYDTPLAQIHRNPAPQVAEGIWLGERPEVHAMMDISDGIASDLRHILHQSGVGAEVDTECIPTPVDLETAVSGGEDYKLLFTVAPESANTLLSTTGSVSAMSSTSSAASRAAIISNGSETAPLCRSIGRDSATIDRRSEKVATTRHIPSSEISEGHPPYRSSYLLLLRRKEPLQIRSASPAAIFPLQALEIPAIHRKLSPKRSRLLPYDIGTVRRKK